MKCIHFFSWPFKFNTDASMAYQTLCDLSLFTSKPVPLPCVLSSRCSELLRISFPAVPLPGGALSPFHTQLFMILQLLSKCHPQRDLPRRLQLNLPCISKLCHSALLISACDKCSERGHLHVIHLISKCMM